MIRTAILTISDSASQGTRADRSGPALQERLAELGWPSQVTVIPDEQPQIARLLVELADSGSFDLVLTTGGTGIAARDVTPEATRSVIEREIPGIGEWMRRSGRDSIKTAILSRALAGSRGRVLIINLPGSPKGAVESFNAVYDVIPHAVDLLRGKTEH